MSAWAAVLLGATALGLVALGAELYGRFHRSLTPAQRERLRRLKVQAEGRVGDALITEVRGWVVYYHYRVGRIEYVASQDLSALSHLLAGQLTGMSGHASVKYLPANPANSIVASEGWCGLHKRPELEPPQPS